MKNSIVRELLFNTPPIQKFQSLIKVEPYWNVKSEMILNVDNDEKIKVEPYWNVKEDKGVKLIDILDIKVEPYWNVKTQ